MSYHWNSSLVRPHLFLVDGKPCIVSDAKNVLTICPPKLLTRRVAHLYPFNNHEFDSMLDRNPIEIINAYSKIYDDSTSGGLHRGSVSLDALRDYSRHIFASVFSPKSVIASVHCHVGIDSHMVVRTNDGRSHVLETGSKFRVHMIAGKAVLCSSTPSSECFCHYTTSIGFGIGPNRYGYMQLSPHPFGSAQHFDHIPDQSYRILLSIENYLRQSPNLANPDYFDLLLANEKITGKNFKKNTKIFVTDFDDLGCEPSKVSSYANQKNLNSHVSVSFCFSRSTFSTGAIDVDVILCLFDSFKVSVSQPILAHSPGFFTFGTAANPIVASLDDETKDLLARCVTAASDIASSISSTADGIPSLIVEHAPRVGILILAFFACKRLLENLTSNIVDGLTQRIMDFVNSIIGVVVGPLEIPIIAHIGDSTDSGIPWANILSTTLGAVYFSITGRSSKGINFKDSIKFLSDLPKAADGISKVFEAFLKVLRYAYDRVKCYIHGETYVAEMKTIYPTVQRFYDRALEVIAKSDARQLDVNVYNYTTLNSILCDGRTICSFGKFGPDTSSIVANVKYLLNIIEKVRSPFVRSTIMGEFTRMEPLTILLRGASGVGKSVMTEPFITRLLARILPKDMLGEFEKRPTEYIYNRMPEHAYWDGYQGQMVTVFDDMGQCVDVAGNPDNEYMSIIRATNIFPYALHMASLEEKGSTLFTSKIVICTTNSKTFTHVQSIHHKEALIRRFDLIVDVDVNRSVDEITGEYKYAVQRPGCDEFKVRKDIAYTDDVWRFHEMTNVRVDHSGMVAHTYTFPGIIKRAVGLYNAKLEKVQMISAATRLDLEKEIVDRLAGIPMVDLDDYDLDYGGAFCTMDNPCGLDTCNDCYTPIPGQVPNYYYDSEGEQMDDERSVYTDAKDDAPLPGPNLPLTREQILLAGCKPMVNGIVAQIHLDTLKDFVLFRTKQGLNFCSDTIGPYLDWLHLKRNEQYHKLVALANESQTDFVSMFSTVLSNSRVIFERFERSFKEALSSVVSNYPLLSACGTIITIIGAYSVCSSLFSPAVHPESSPNLNKKQSHRGRIGKNKGHRMGFEDDDNYGVIPQGPLDDSVEARSRKIVNRSYVTFVLPRASSKSGTILMVSGTLGLLPHHYWAELEHGLAKGRFKPNEFIEFFKTSGTCIKTCTVKEFLEAPRKKFQEKDLCMFELPGKMVVFPNIINHIANITRIEELRKVKAVVLLSEPFDDDLDGLREVPIDVTIGPAWLPYTSSSGLKLGTPSSYKYHSDTSPGDCGSCSILTDTKHAKNGLIFGMHVAGQDSLTSIGVGYGVMFHRDEVSDMFDSFNKLSAQGPPIPEDLVTGELPDTPLDQNFTILGKVSKQPSRVTKSSLQKIPHMFESLGPTSKIPACLGMININGDRVDPMKKSIMKYSGTTPAINKKIVQYASTYYYSYLLTESKVDVTRDILSYESAVKGEDGVPYLDAINRRTSPGYPMNLFRPAGSKGKRWWLGEDEDFNFNSKDAIKLRLNVEDIISKAKSGIRSSHIYMDCLKDELRPIQKVAEGKTRLISAAPLPYVIACRQYFLSFSRWMMMNRVNNGVAVGVNPFSKDWDHMVHQLQSKGRNLIAGDFSAWDSTMYSEVGESIIDMINEWYNDSEESKTVRRVLFMEMYSSVHLFRDILYVWHKGMPSGNPLTSILNSIYNNIIIRCAYIMAMESFESIKDFDHNVYMCAYGDDNVISVSDKVKDAFNMGVLTECLAEFGMTYTDDNKNSGNVTFRSIGEISFLKRGFVFNEARNKWLAPLDYESIRHQMYYCDDMDRVCDILKQSYDTFLLELSLHGEEVFDKTVKQVAPILKEHYMIVAPSTVSEFHLDAALASRDVWY
jgi:hypothetical protein